MSRPQDVHANSIAAYYSEEPKLSARAGAILAYIHVHGAATDRQVMVGMGFRDMNAVRPRITELIDAGLLVELAIADVRRAFRMAKAPTHPMLLAARMLLKRFEGRT